MGPTGRPGGIRRSSTPSGKPRHATDPTSRSKGRAEASRSSARLMINDLSSRRPDWPQIPWHWLSLTSRNLPRPTSTTADQEAQGG